LKTIPKMQQDKVYKYRLKVRKLRELKFISHLDWQNLILKVFRRCSLKLALSQGFNKMPKVSYSPALPIFIESDCELINFQVLEKLEDNFLENFKKNSPQGLEIVQLYEILENSDEPKSLENYCQWAQYEAVLKENTDRDIYNFKKISYIIGKCLSSSELLITKKTKKGIEKTINYRNSLKELSLIGENNHFSLAMILKTGQNDEIPALRADEFLNVIFDDKNIFKIKRIKFFDTDLKEI